jgi:hypothetical protein
VRGGIASGDLDYEEGLRARCHWKISNTVIRMPKAGARGRRLREREQQHVTLRISLRTGRMSDILKEFPSGT